jgi:hypothetical protein
LQLQNAGLLTSIALHRQYIQVLMSVRRKRAFRRPNKTTAGAVPAVELKATISAN